MEYMGDLNQLSDEERLALRSVIVDFKTYVADHPEKPAIGTEPKLTLTSAELAGVYPSEPNLDIYTSVRDYLLDKAPSPRRHSR